METDRLSEIGVICWIATHINLLDNVDLTELGVIYWNANRPIDFYTYFGPSADLMNTLGEGVSIAPGTSRWSFKMKISALRDNKEQLYEAVFSPHDRIQTNMNALTILIKTIQIANIEILAEAFDKACESSQQNVIELCLIRHCTSSSLFFYPVYKRTQATGINVIRWMVNNIKALNNFEYLRKTLNVALENNRPDVVKELIARPALRNDLSALGEAWSVACKRDWLNLVEWMVNNTLLCYDSEKLGNALLSACSAHIINTVAHWIGVNNDVNANKRALYLACEKSHLKVLQQIAENTTLFNDMETVSVALTTACVHGQPNVVEYIVTQGKLTDKLDILLNALSSSCESGRVDVVKWLIEHTALRNADNETLNVSLDRACWSGQLNVVKWLIDNTAVEINCANDEENSPLHSVIWKDKMGDSKPLHWACRPAGDLEKVCELIYVHGNSVNEQDNNGDIALHRACYNGSIVIAEILMSAGADVTITNDERLTPVQMAENEGHKELLKVLNRLAL